MKDRTYIAIDLKSFYASVECRERGRDPGIHKNAASEEISGAALLYTVRFGACLDTFRDG